MLYPSFQSLSLLQAAPSTRQPYSTPLASRKKENFWGLVLCSEEGEDSLYCSSFMLLYRNPVASTPVGCCWWMYFLLARDFKLPCHFRNYVTCGWAVIRPIWIPSPPWTLSAAPKLSGASIQMHLVCCCQSSHRMLRSLTWLSRGFMLAFVTVPH